MTRRGSSPAFIGRHAELGRLDAALDRAALGDPSVMLLAGEAGVGKSRLASEFMDRAEAGGSMTIVGGCLDLDGGGMPYAPFVEAFRALADRLDGDERVAIFDPWAGELGTLVPHLSAGGTAERDATDSAGQLARLFDAVIAVLGRLGTEQPLLMVLEDIHWADGSTRDLLRFLVRNLRHERLLVLATYRSDDLHRRHPLMPLLAELQRADRVERIELRRFDRDELRELVAEISGSVPPEPLVDALLERSDGLPFYIEELMADSKDDAARLPSSLRDILGSRLAALSSAARLLVQAAAVIGGRIPHTRLVAVAGQDDETIRAALREAIDGWLVVPIEDPDGPAYAFRHALVREAAYDEILPAERVHLHARLADHLEALIRSSAAPDPAIVADFALQAYAAHDLPRALRGSIGALHALIDAVAYRDALVHAERALELWPRVDDAQRHAGIDHGRLLALAGRMASAANRPDRAMALTRDALAELDAGDDRIGQAELLVDLQWYAWESRAFEAGVAAAERAYDLAVSSDATRLKAQVTTILGSQRWWQGRLLESARLLEEAMAIADEIGDSSIWAEAADDLAHTLADLGQAARASALLDRSSGVGTGEQWRVERISSLIDRSVALVTCGRFAEAEQIAAVGLQVARRYGWDERFGPYFRSCIVDALFELGRYDEAALIAEPVLAGSPLLVYEWMATSMARVLVAQGRFEDAHRLLDLEPGGLTPNERTIFLVPAVELARAEGRLADVVAVIDGLTVDLGDRESVAGVWGLLGSGIGACADAVVELDRRRRPAQAAELAATAERWLGALRALAVRHRDGGGGGPYFEAILATAEAEVGRILGAPGAETWRSVADRWLTLSHAHQTAYARLRLAEACLQVAGGRTAAETALREAHAIAQTIGAVPLRSAIESLAARARLHTDQDERVAPPTLGGPSVLTARERDVLSLVTEGHTNREIGAQLFISEKTVSVHVSNAMAKLGALSRYEAAATANRLGYLGNGPSS